MDCWELALECGSSGPSSVPDFWNITKWSLLHPIRCQCHAACQWVGVCRGTPSCPSVQLVEDPRCICGWWKPESSPWLSTQSPINYALSCSEAYSVTSHFVITVLHVGMCWTSYTTLTSSSLISNKSCVTGNMVETVSSKETLQNKNIFYDKKSHFPCFWLSSGRYQ